MRKVIFFMSTSLDGYIEGPKREIDWHHVDEEFNEFAIQQLNEADLLLFGRVTYELMAGFWPTKEAIQTDPIVAGLMNSKSKIVFSSSLSRAEWHNTRLVKTDFVSELSRLKKEPGKGLILLGGSDLVVSGLQAGLLDEIRIMLNPLVLGSGKTLFKGLQNRLDLKLLNTRIFKNGNVLLSYQPVYQKENA